MGNCRSRCRLAEIQRVGSSLALISLKGSNNTVQRHIELLIGRLATDEDFRRAFQTDPRRTLGEAAEWGLALSAIEVTALLATDQTLWDRIAVELDSRLQKASFRTPAERR